MTTKRNRNAPEIIYKALAELKLYENNPRNNEPAVPAVMASIKEFGFKVPIIADADGVIIAGHTRYKAAQKLGLDSVPVIMADDLTSEQAAAFRLADNKTAELAEWDPYLLEQELAATEKELSFDMADFGFIKEEISPDSFDTEFSLPDGEKDPIVTVSFTLAKEQSDFINAACDLVRDEVAETFGNTHEKSNQLYEIIRQWHNMGADQQQPENNN